MFIDTEDDHGTGGPEDRNVAEYCSGKAGSDDRDDARNREDSIAADDPVQNRAEEHGIARTSGVGVPKEPGRDVAEKGDHCRDV